MSQSTPDGAVGRNRAGGAEGTELRPATDDDRAFLLAVYASTRAEELAVVPWTDEQKAAFILMQFEAQDASYRQSYPEADFSVIRRDGVDVGRLYVARLDTEVLLVDIALLPEYRGRGIGTQLIGDLLASADKDALPVTLHVKPGSPAKRLYRRLGFESRGVSGPYESMVRPARPAGVS